MDDGLDGSEKEAPRFQCPEQVAAGHLCNSAPKHAGRLLDLFHLGGANGCIILDRIPVAGDVALRRHATQLLKPASCEDDGIDNFPAGWRRCLPGAVVIINLAGWLRCVGSIRIGFVLALAAGRRWERGGEIRQVDLLEGEREHTRRRKQPCHRMINHSRSEFGWRRRRRAFARAFGAAVGIEGCGIQTAGEVARVIGARGVAPTDLCWINRSNRHEAEAAALALTADRCELGRVASIAAPVVDGTQRVARAIRCRDKHAARCIVELAARIAVLAARGIIPLAARHCITPEEIITGGSAVVTAQLRRHLAFIIIARAVGDVGAVAATVAVFHTIYGAVARSRHGGAIVATISGTHARTVTEAVRQLKFILVV